MMNSVLKTAKKLPCLQKILRILIFQMYGHAPVNFKTVS